MKYLHTISGRKAKLPITLGGVGSYFYDINADRIAVSAVLSIINTPRPAVPPTLAKLERAAIAWRKRRNASTESALFDAAFKHERHLAKTP